MKTIRNIKDYTVIEMFIVIIIIGSIIIIPIYSCNSWKFKGILNVNYPTITLTQDKKIVNLDFENKSDSYYVLNGIHNVKFKPNNHKFDILEILVNGRCIYFHIIN